MFILKGEEALTPIFYPPHILFLTITILVGVNKFDNIDFLFLTSIKLLNISFLFDHFLNIFLLVGGYIF